MVHRPCKDTNILPPKVALKCDLQASRLFEEVVGYWVVIQQNKLLAKLSKRFVTNLCKNPQLVELETRILWHVPNFAFDFGC
jgi:hypothetical protein